MEALHGFLRAHQDNGYTEEELREEARPQEWKELRIGVAPGAAWAPSEGDPTVLKAPAGSLSKERVKVFGAALKKLVELGAVESKRVAAVPHYRYKQELPTLDN